ncbi:MAG: hypothetical protein Q8R02_23655 [Hyphomonadaceae bacterium]|nr:hypothetical protein [Hyphomonadaceae bacterium]
MIRSIVNRLPACIAATLVVLALGACSAPPAANTEATAVSTTEVATPAPADAPAAPPPVTDPTAPGVDPCKHPSPPSYCSNN